MCPSLNKSLDPWKLAFGIDRVVPKITIPKAETILDEAPSPSEAAPTVTPQDAKGR